MLRVALATFLSLSPVSALAHEFWIHALDWQIEAGDRLLADIKVGEEMKANGMPFLPAQTRRSQLRSPQGLFALNGKIGDRPAIQFETQSPGLHVLVHQTDNLILTYQEMAKFMAFVQHKDLGVDETAHTERGLPLEGFKERYSRYAKALVAVGHGRGSDAEVGLETELIALKNPYVDRLSGEMPVKLTYQGAPRKQAQVEVFELSEDGQVSITFVRTNEAGIALVPVRAGFTYMLDSVVLRPVDVGAEDEAVWESLWANLTFAVPGQD